MTINILIGQNLNKTKEVKEQMDETSNEEIKISYIKKKVNKINEDKTTIDILVTIESSKGIKNIIKPDGVELNLAANKTKIAIDLTVNEKEDYIFKVIGNNGIRKRRNNKCISLTEIYLQ